LTQYAEEIRIHNIAKTKSIELFVLSLNASGTWLIRIFWKFSFRLKKNLSNQDLEIQNLRERLIHQELEILKNLML